jgi:hypothetical protein
MSTIDPLSGTSPLGAGSQTTSPSPANTGYVQLFNQAMASGSTSGGTASAPNTDSEDWAAFWSSLPNMIVTQGMNRLQEYRTRIREIDTE